MTIQSKAIALTCLAVVAAQAPAAPPEPSRQDTVRTLGADVMPFDMAATSHIFTPTPRGGVQRVVARKPDDTRQTLLVRAHLRDLVDRFRRRDFSGPTHVHGGAMPGLAALRAAPPKDLLIADRDIGGGGEVEYTSDRPQIVAALHQWIRAQLADHGDDATMGHDHSMHHPR